MSHSPVEIQPPDLTPFRDGNTGIDYVHVVDSGRAGPQVMVQALTHGNEFCGAIALISLLQQGLRPLRGSLTVAFANVAAFARFDFDDPDRARYIEEDYNRVWADDVLLGSRDSLELRRARELAPFVDRADLLLDLHSMHEPCRPIMVCGRIDKGVEFARAIGVPGDLLVDTGHPGGLRMIERGGFGDPASPRKAALIECGQHWERSAVDVAFDTLLRFLRATGAFDDAWLEARLRLTPPPRQRVIRVTEAVVAKTMQFRFAANWRGLDVVPAAGTPIAHDGDTTWRAPYDNTVLVMPSLAHLKPGTTMVRLGRYD
ncbi:MAG TPA: succinylglutamate desuccinylase/aspartoacylase family protein [Burkholderiaceae bacterium]|nr:succinylglutamate desuccinylase/aspartoacylase family protein [Burkholderiaceae bacterium]